MFYHIKTAQTFPFISILIASAFIKFPLILLPLNILSKSLLLLVLILLFFLKHHSSKVLHSIKIVFMHDVISMVLFLQSFYKIIGNEYNIRNKM